MVSCQVMSNSLWPHELWHARLPCPSLSPGVCSNSCPLNQWCYLIISSSATPFSFSIQSFPASGSFPMSRLFASKVLELQFRHQSSNEQPGLVSFRIDWFYLLAVQGTLKSLLQQHNSKASIVWRSAFSMIQLSHLYMTYWKNHSLDCMDLCGQSDVSAF